MTKSGMHRAYTTCAHAVLTGLVLGFATPASAQDFSAFENGLTDCVNYMKLRPQVEVTGFQGNAQPARISEEGISGDVLYPVTAGGSTWDYAITYEYEAGNSINPPEWTCSGAGKVAPTWPMFTTVGWVSADARIRAGGMVELNFPGGPKAYANCTAEVPDLFITLSPGAGDRVVFASLTGPAAQAYCTSLGVKDRLVFAFALMMVAGAAQAGAWEEFERRCLVPMENFAAPNTRGFPIDYHMSRREYFVYWSVTDRLMMRLHFDTSSAVSEDVVMCTISQLDNEPSFVQVKSDVQAGMSALISTGDFRNTSGPASLHDVRAGAGLRTGGIECDAAIETNQVREPVLRICLWQVEADNWGITALETDLES